MGTDIDPVLVTGLVENFSPMPRMAPPPYEQTEGRCMDLVIIGTRLGVPGVSPVLLSLIVHYPTLWTCPTYVTRDDRGQLRTAQPNLGLDLTTCWQWTQKSRNAQRSLNPGRFRQSGFPKGIRDFPLLPHDRFGFIVVSLDYDTKLFSIQLRSSLRNQATSIRESYQLNLMTVRQLSN
jgi:hypothetical protein